MIQEINSIIFKQFRSQRLLTNSLLKLSSLMSVILDFTILRNTFIVSVIRPDHPRRSRWIKFKVNLPITICRRNLIPCSMTSIFILRFSRAYQKSAFIEIRCICILYVYVVYGGDGTKFWLKPFNCTVTTRNMNDLLSSDADERLR